MHRKRRVAARGRHRLVLVIAGAVFVTGAIAFLAAPTFVGHPALPFGQAAGDELAVAPETNSRGERPVYPYSVVSGGVYNAQEAAQAVRSDPVVREHYKRVRLQWLRAERTRRPMLAYVSYRRGEQVTWTHRQLRIPEGELVLTDGSTVVRARCGNLVSELPPPLSSAPESKDDPPELFLETPAPPILSTPPVSSELRPLAPPVEPSPSVPAQPAAQIPFIPLPPIGPPGDNSGTPPILPPGEPPDGPGPPIPIEPPAPVPEPGTLLLFTSGIGVLTALTWRRRR